jgi:hypothetical protein
VKQKTVATQVQNDLKAAGITVVIDQTCNSYFKTLRSDNLPDMARAGWCRTGRRSLQSLRPAGW